MSKTKKWKPKDRVFHIAFGWATVLAPELNGRLLVDLDADEIEYYKMGYGRVSFKREKQTGKHIFFGPADQFYNEEPKHLSEKDHLTRLSLAPKLSFWNKSL